MGSPLNCLAPEPGQVCKPGGPVPLTRIKTLVSMTTPRDYRYYINSTVLYIDLYLSFMFVFCVNTNIRPNVVDDYKVMHTATNCK